jgi:hypothetical protein
MTQTSPTPCQLPPQYWPEEKPACLYPNLFPDCESTHSRQARDMVLQLRPFAIFGLKCDHPIGELN